MLIINKVSVKKALGFLYNTVNDLFVIIIILPFKPIVLFIIRYENLKLLAL